MGALGLKMQLRFLRKWSIPSLSEAHRGGLGEGLWERKN